MAEVKKSINDALQDLIRFLNIFPMVQGMRESLEVALNLEGQTAVLNDEIKTLSQKKEAQQKELDGLQKRVNAATAAAEEKIAEFEASVNAKRQERDKAIAGLEEEYRQAQVRAGETLEKQLLKNRAEIDEWTQKLGTVQRQVHRLEAESLLMEQRKAQA